MDKWAAAYKDSAAFICVSCAGPALAQKFGTDLKLKYCTNSFVDQAGGPRWGQLGCNGFIVLDSCLNVVCESSAAFLEVRGLAFQHVEALLDALVHDAPPPRICPGQQVFLAGLKVADLNGQRGLCTSLPDDRGRCAVSLRSGRRVSVPLSNLHIEGEEGDMVEDEELPEGQSES